jgi:hypothetical protein
MAPSCLITSFVVRRRRVTSFRATAWPHDSSSPMPMPTTRSMRPAILPNVVEFGPNALDVCEYEGTTPSRPTPTDRSSRGSAAA